MVFDIYAFGEVCVWVLPLTIFLAFFVTTFVMALASHGSMGAQIAVLFNYIFCLGVIAHEGAHLAMCKVFGVEVKDVCFFRVERKIDKGRESLNIGGYVDTGEINSFIAGFFIAIAPLLISGLLFATIYYFGPFWLGTAWEPLLIYFGFALVLGAHPSKGDIKAWWATLQKYPGRGFFEFFLLCVFGIVVYYLTYYQISVWYFGGVVLLFLILCVVQGRATLNPAQKRYVK
jgi:hypothetical protein